jgi:hypothetical protein
MPNSSLCHKFYRGLWCSTVRHDRVLGTLSFSQMRVSVGSAARSMMMRVISVSGATTQSEAAFSFSKGERTIFRLPHAQSTFDGRFCEITAVSPASDVCL